MKWFKHMSKSRHDTKVMRIIRKHGLRGYGLYFAVLEGIAFDLEPEKPVPELEETAQDIAAFFNEDTLKVQEIVDDCVREGLLQVNPETKRILCLKLLVYLDNTLSQNPQVKAILSNFKSLEAEGLKQIRLDEIRLDETRSDKNNNIASDAGVPSSSPLKGNSIRSTKKSSRAPSAAEAEYARLWKESTGHDMTNELTGKECIMLNKYAKEYANMQWQGRMAAFFKNEFARTTGYAIGLFLSAKTQRELSLQVERLAPTATYQGNASTDNAPEADDMEYVKELSEKIKAGQK